jgi:hypothetical protein
MQAQGRHRAAIFMPGSYWNFYAETEFAGLDACVGVRR